MADFFNTTGGMALIMVAQVLAMVAFVMISLLFLVYGDRKVWAAVQMRRGPNVVGVFGLLQTVADALKYVVKEVVIPAGADRAVFMLAPLTSFVLALIAWAVIPFNDTWVLSDINVAILYVFAVSSLEVYGVIMGGWASNSKYPFLGSLRSAAQMISYEVSIGLIIIGVIISTGSMNFGDIVRAQDGDYGFFSWYWLPHFPMVFLFFISALAETNRPPFDLPVLVSWCGRQFGQSIGRRTAEFEFQPVCGIHAGQGIDLGLGPAKRAPGQETYSCGWGFNEGLGADRRRWRPARWWRWRIAATPAAARDKQQTGPAKTQQTNSAQAFHFRPPPEHLRPPYFNGKRDQFRRQLTHFSNAGHRKGGVAVNRRPVSQAGVTSPQTMKGGLSYPLWILP